MVSEVETAVIFSGALTSSDVERRFASSRFVSAAAGTPASAELNPKHKYEKSGTFRASVEVSDASGDSDSDYVDIEIGAE